MTDGVARYGKVLATPGAWGFFVPGMLARFPLGMTGISILLFVSAKRHDYGTAGALSAVTAVGYAVAAPQLARLSDQLGQRRVLLSCAVLCAVGGSGFVAGVMSTATPLWVLFATAAVVGGATPAIGSMVRARWSGLLDGSSLKGTAFALESLVDEAIFIVGPVIATSLAVGVSAAAGIISALILVCGGSVLLSFSVRTEPQLKPGTRAQGSALFLLPVAVIAGVNLCLGGMWGSIDIATVAFSSAEHHRFMAGVLLGIYAVGSSVAGVVYGAREWSTPVPRILWASTLIMAVGILPMLLVHSFVGAGLVLLVAGASSCPAMIAAMMLVGDGVPASRRTEALAWQSTALWLGVAIGSSASGHLADSRGAHVAYACAAVCGGAGFFVALAARHRIELPLPEPADSPAANRPFLPTEPSAR
ncbi:MFS transporter [Actinacidiphila sp. ITFR-21]|uniref:MFS transporter n=1 Tax=Actinacidiphila sp. ITFR-21 TaxID=3075199 RepID=UPI00288A483F|nr:MFS transporter [Streptomyces sp. ITFR-21]WNI18066.1 MFS transporter [Streptomyces sp. ITFR-21]